MRNGTRPRLESEAVFSRCSQRASGLQLLHICPHLLYRQNMLNLLADQRINSNSAAVHPSGKCSTLAVELHVRD